MERGEGLTVSRIMERGEGLVEGVDSSAQPLRGKPPLSPWACAPYGLHHKSYKPVSFQPESNPTVVTATMSTGVTLTMTSRDSNEETQELPPQGKKQQKSGNTSSIKVGHKSITGDGENGESTSILQPPPPPPPPPHQAFPLFGSGWGSDDEFEAVFERNLEAVRGVPSSYSLNSSYSLTAEEDSSGATTPNRERKQAGETSVHNSMNEKHQQLQNEELQEQLQFEEQQQLQQQQNELQQDQDQQLLVDETGERSDNQMYDNVKDDAGTEQVSCKKIQILGCKDDKHDDDDIAVTSMTVVVPAALETSSFKKDLVVAEADNSHYEGESREVSTSDRQCSVDSRDDVMADRDETLSSPPPQGYIIAGLIGFQSRARSNSQSDAEKDDQQEIPLSSQHSPRSLSKAELFHPAAVPKRVDEQHIRDEPCLEAELVPLVVSAELTVSSSAVSQTSADSPVEVSSLVPTPAREINVPFSTPTGVTSPATIVATSPSIATTTTTATTVCSTHPSKAYTVEHTASCLLVSPPPRPPAVSSLHLPSSASLDSPTENSGTPSLEYEAGLSQKDVINEAERRQSSSRIPPPLQFESVSKYNREFFPSPPLSPSPPTPPPPPLSPALSTKKAMTQPMSPLIKKRQEFAASAGSEKDAHSRDYLRYAKKQPTGSRDRRCISLFQVEVGETNTASSDADKRQSLDNAQLSGYFPILPSSPEVNRGTRLFRMQQQKLSFEEEEVNSPSEPEAAPKCKSKRGPPPVPPPKPASCRRTKSAPFPCSSGSPAAISAEVAPGEPIPVQGRSTTNTKSIRPDSSTKPKSTSQISTSNARSATFDSEAFPPPPGVSVNLRGTERYGVKTGSAVNLTDRSVHPAAVGAASSSGMVSHEEIWIPTHQPYLKNRVNGESGSRSESKPTVGSGLPKSQNPTITLLQKGRDDSDDLFSEIAAQLMLNQDELVSAVDHAGELPKGADYNSEKVRKSQSMRSKMDPSQKQWYKQMFQSLHRPDTKSRDILDTYLPVNDSPRLNHGTDALPEWNPASVPTESAVNNSTWDMPHPSDNSNNVRLREHRNQQTRYAVSYTDTRTDSHSMDSPFVLRDSAVDSHSTSTTDSIHSPTETGKQAYKFVQQGGEIPYSGFRKPAPTTPPPKGPAAPPPDPVAGYNRAPSPLNRRDRDEQDTKRRELMRHIEEEEKKKKALEEQTKLMARRHHDNLVPKEKAAIRQDRFDEYDTGPLSPRSSTRGGVGGSFGRKSEPRAQALALYTFRAQNSKELGFQKGDTIYLLRQIDQNWLEGEHHGTIGIFPIKYVQVTVSFEQAATASFGVIEGLGKAKYNFTAQTAIELPLTKGESIVLIRRVDSNWYEGRCKERIGIFPVSYVEVIAEPRMADDLAELRSPTHFHGNQSPTTTRHQQSFNHEVPSSISQRVSSPLSRQHSGLNTGQLSVSAQLTGSSGYGSPDQGSPKSAAIGSGKGQEVLDGRSRGTSSGQLHSSNRAEPAGAARHQNSGGLDHMPSYRILYNYHPRNSDELDLREGDVVHVTERCDDGWYVGTSGRTGSHGTFPGNYATPV